VTELLDCVVVGGGPAGLTAALYLARYRRSVTVVDRGGSRAALIPLSRNYAGFPDGITGADLLARMRAQAERYGATIVSGDAQSVERAEPNWRVEGPGIALAARSLLFATGVVNIIPAGVADAVLAAALARGQLRYCPICDGFEAGGLTAQARIGVVGAKSRGVAEALFLRTFSNTVTLFTRETFELHEKDRADLAKAGVAWDPRPIARYAFEPEAVTLHFSQGASAQVDTLYPALGSRPNVALMDRLGLRTDPERCIVTDAHQRLGLRGLYAAGDVVSALDQICVATAHGATSATAIHNDLRDHDGLTPV
jgi:thioredoxin reductase (NADPH)